MLSAEPLAALALGVLAVLFLWKISLPVLLPAPVRLDEAFPSARTSPDDSASFILLMAAGGGPGDAAASLRQLAPGRRVEIRRIDWSAASRGRGTRADQRVAALMHAYGYSRPPLLLTFDGQGHLVRIGSVPQS